VGEKSDARKLSEQFQESIMAELRGGSLSAADIARRIGHNMISITQYLCVLEKAGWARREKWIHRAGRSSYWLWAIDRNKTPKPAPVDKSEIGLDDADREWMRYWRLPRVERRRQAIETNAENAK
jgi:hypothetical protein